MDKPLVLLVDGDSASASEIVAACLKDHDRAVVVGERSFGKGSVQNVFSLESGRSALKLTTSRYYRPSGANIHRDVDAGIEDDWGVRPTEGYEVVLDDAARRRANLRWELATYPSMAEAVVEDSPADGPLEEVDPQLWKALQAIEEKSANPPAQPTDTRPVRT